MIESVKTRIGGVGGRFMEDVIEQEACEEYESLLHAYPADLCALGIGENGHLAFNDPPADFETHAHSFSVS